MSKNYPLVNSGRGGRGGRGGNRAPRWSVPDADDNRGALFVDLYFATASGGSANAPGATASYQYSAIGGAATGGASASGAIASYQYLAIGGAANAGSPANAPGSVVSYQYSIVAGSASGGASAPGAIASFSYSRIAGAATGAAQANGGVAGYNYQATGGVASGGNAANAPGALAGYVYSALGGIASAGSTQSNGGGEARARLEVMRKTLREFEDEQERIKSRDSLPQIAEPQRKAIKAAARKLAKSPEPFGFEDIEQQIKASMLPIEVQPLELHIDWMLYFLRIEAYHLRLESEEEEIAMALLLL